LKNLWRTVNDLKRALSSDLGRVDSGEGWGSATEGEETDEDAKEEAMQSPAR